MQHECMTLPKCQCTTDQYHLFKNAIVPSTLLELAFHL